MSVIGLPHPHVRFTEACDQCDELRAKVASAIRQHPSSGTQTSASMITGSGDEQSPPEPPAAPLSDVDGVTVHLDHLDAQMRSERLWDDLEEAWVAETAGSVIDLAAKRDTRQARRRIIHYVLMHAHEIDLGVDET